MTVMDSRNLMTEAYPFLSDYHLYIDPDFPDRPYSLKTRDKGLGWIWVCAYNANEVYERLRFKTRLEAFAYVLTQYRKKEYNGKSRPVAWGNLDDYLHPQEGNNDSN